MSENRKQININIKTEKRRTDMIKEAIYELVNGNNLSYDMAEEVMDEIMSGEESGVTPIMPPS